MRTRHWCNRRERTAPSEGGSGARRRAVPAMSGPSGSGALPRDHGRAGAVMVDDGRGAATRRRCADVVGRRPGRAVVVSAAGVVPRVRNRAAALFAVLVLAVTAACTGGDGSSPSSTSPSPRTGAATHVLAVKIDNVAPARPHTGLEGADIVYVEQVEAGLSRILAVYSADLPPVIGPVRSARETDLELLRQFDRPALAFSGRRAGCCRSSTARRSMPYRLPRRPGRTSGVRTAPRRTTCICGRSGSRSRPPGWMRLRSSGSGSVRRRPAGSRRTAVRSAIRPRR